MVAAPQNLDAGERLELTITRTIDAPRELVWTVWTDPKHAKHWGPEGFLVEPISAEPRVGGKWRVRLRPHDGGRDLYQGGVFREIVEPERLVYTFAWDNEDGAKGEEMLITLILEDVGGKTKLTFHQVGFSSAASRDGHEEGWCQAIDALVAHAEKL